MKYTQAHFVSDLNKLKNMLNSKVDNKSVKYGGDIEKNNFRMGEGGGEKGEVIRWFKLVSVNRKILSQPKGRYRAYTIKMVKVKGGGKKLNDVRETPLNAAKRAFKQICQGKNESCNMYFTIKETTHGSDKKEYKYYGKKIKLPKQITMVMNGKKIIMEYEINVKKINEKEKK